MDDTISKSKEKQTVLIGGEPWGKEHPCYYGHWYPKDIGIPYEERDCRRCGHTYGDEGIVVKSVEIEP